MRSIRTGSTNLEIFDRQTRQGVEMTKNELDDLEFFKKRQQRLEKHRKEYNNILDRQDNGKEVSKDQLLFLGVG